MIEDSLNVFKWHKKVIDGDNNIPIFWLGGWPSVLKKHIKYDGQFFYINTHYNRFSNIPPINSSVTEFSAHICDQILNLTKSKNIILAGYSIGAVFSLELAKLLTSKGKYIETIFLLDPSDTIYIKDNQLSTNLLFNKILLYCRAHFYKKLWYISQLLHINIFLRGTCIHSIYAYYRIKYNFKQCDKKVIMIQRKNNKSKTLFNWRQLFKKELLKTYQVEYESHSDFFQNTICIHEWTDIFNKEIS